MKRALTLWRFGRPHTLIGTAISICTLYVIVCDVQGGSHPLLLLVALASGLSCNVFIVGINQVADVEIDRINKPYLPIPSGALSVKQASIIVCAALASCLLLALFVSPWLFGILALASGIGWAYSMPPFHLKRHHLPAAIAITTVRGVLVNVGGFLVFNYLVNGTLGLPRNVQLLTVFIIAFSIAIAWFKDLPDVEGDARYSIRTLALLYSPRLALLAGHALVGAAYVFTIVMQYRDLHTAEDPTLETKVLLGGHVLLFVLFLVNATTMRLGQHASMRTFYARFWWFFFAEYVLYLIAYLVP